MTPAVSMHSCCVNSINKPSPPYLSLAASSKVKHLEVRLGWKVKTKLFRLHQDALIKSISGLEPV